MFFEKISILNENFEIENDVDVVIEGEFIKEIRRSSSDNSSTSKESQIRQEIYEDESIICGKNKLLIPGFFNAHAHSPMSLMRGYGENMMLQDWLFNRIFPFESKLTGKDVYWATLLTMAESMKYGIVSNSDMYYLLDDMAEAIHESKMKGNIAQGVGNIEHEPFESLPSIKATIDAFKKHHNTYNKRIKVDASIHAEYTSDEQTVRGLAELAKDLGMRMHVHVSETKSEHEECKKRHSGKTPVEYLADCGLFDVPAIAAHCVWVEDNDRSILSDKGVTVATNAVSNLKLASGICDVKKLIDSNISVAIGTDSVASNNNLNFFEEIKTMSLLAKVRSKSPTVITPKQAIKMATFNGAKAQGRDDCGSIKIGNKADIVMLNTDDVNMTPQHDLLNNVVLSATDSNIDLTMVDGNVLYKRGEYLTIDIDRVKFEVRNATDRILKEL